MQFNKTRRQKFLSEEDYNDDEAIYEKDFKEKNEILKTGLYKGMVVSPEAYSRFRWWNASWRLHSLLLRYTAGRPMEELRTQLNEVIGCFDEFMKHEGLPRENRPDLNEADPLEISQLDAYVCVFWLLALCKLLRRDELIEKVMGWVNRTYKYNRGVDELFESVARKLTGDYVDAHQELFYPNPYGPLAAATAAMPEERPALVKACVESWYKGMKPCNWYGSHKNCLYFGYWCLEAALVTVLWDIDDSSYRDHLVYPKDLVDWYRAQIQSSRS